MPITWAMSRRQVKPIRTHIRAWMGVPSGSTARAMAAESMTAMRLTTQEFCARGDRRYINDG